MESSTGANSSNSSSGDGGDALVPGGPGLRALEAAAAAASAVASAIFDQAAPAIASTANVTGARLMTGVGYRLLASAKFRELVLGCINADFCKQWTDIMSYVLEWTDRNPSDKMNDSISTNA